MVEKWRDNCWSLYGDGSEVSGQGGERGIWMIINACTIVLKCLEWTNMSLLNVQCCVRTRALPITLHQVCRLRLRGEHSRVLSFIQMLLLCVGEAPLLDVKTHVSWFTFTPLKRWLNESSFVLRMSIASDAVARWGTWGHRCDFLMHIYLIFPNANDLPLNVWPPECVFHDTYPFQLLRSISLLPDGQSRWAWASEMLWFISCMNSELSEN